jgi:hypothetical protein
MRGRSRTSREGDGSSIGSSSRESFQKDVQEYLDEHEGLVVTCAYSVARLKNGDVQHSAMIVTRD